eukprot:scaffold69656_cov59-Phaeocystis_antarctica.AAC.2
MRSARDLDSRENRDRAQIAAGARIPLVVDFERGCLWAPPRAQSRRRATRVWRASPHIAYVTQHIALSRHSRPLIMPLPRPSSVRLARAHPRIICPHLYCRHQAGVRRSPDA